MLQRQEWVQKSTTPEKERHTRAERSCLNRRAHYSTTAAPGTEVRSCDTATMSGRKPRTAIPNGSLSNDRVTCKLPSTNKTPITRAQERMPRQQDSCFHRNARRTNLRRQSPRKPSPWQPRNRPEPISDRM